MRVLSDCEYALTKEEKKELQARFLDPDHYAYACKIIENSRICLILGSVAAHVIHSDIEKLGLSVYP
jgi:hypothetical protein